MWANKNNNGGINTDISNTNTRISKAVYLDMYTRYAQYKKDKGVEPNRIYTKKGGQDYVTLQRFKDMQSRFDTYWKAHNVQPNYVYIVKPTTTSTKTAYLSNFESAIGKQVNNFTEAYNTIKNRNYAYYYNDIYDQTAALKRLKNKSGLNCSDICQLMYQVAKDLNYSVRYVHILCKSGAGHIQLDVKGKEFGSSWRRVDPAAALSSGYNLGELWCSNGILLAYNSQFLLTDDGKT